MWVLLGVFALLGASRARRGAGDHAQARDQARLHARQEAQRAPTIDRYVAIGDSCTAGSGIPPVSRNGCQRSERNYPTRIADHFGAILVDVSCGGALTSHAETAQVTDTGTVPPQLRAVGRAADLVTIGLGVNDAGVAPVTYQCLSSAHTDPQGSPSRASFQTEQGDANFNRLPEMGRRVQRIVGQVQKQAPHTRAQRPLWLWTRSSEGSRTLTP
jgi:lysophospholipase L1-like esterase